jgi:hypothetical protein
VQEPIDYSLAVIQQYCLNWGLVCSGETPNLVNARVDLYRAALRLAKVDLAIMLAVCKQGEKAFKRDEVTGKAAVDMKQWGRVSRRLFQILNREGTF